MQEDINTIGVALGDYVSILEQEGRDETKAILANEALQRLNMTNRWIPYTERLPELSCRVIIKFMEFGFGGHHTRFASYSHITKSFCMENKCDAKQCKDWEIIAWMPEPYAPVDRELVGLPIN